MSGTIISGHEAAICSGFSIVLIAADRYSSLKMRIARLRDQTIQGALEVVIVAVSPEGTEEDGADRAVFRRLHVDGFTMYAWLETTSTFGKLRALRSAQRRLGDDLRSEIRATKLLAEYAEALALARGTTSDGKILFKT